MTNSSVQHCYSGLARLKLYLSLSRTPHGLLDMAAPAMAALLGLGGIPPFHVILLGLITVFAGYTSVYALNDVIGYRSDREKLACGALEDPASCADLDALGVRHPMAQGLLSFREGLLWALAWASVALVGAFWLNPICLWIFLAGCTLESAYCLMWRLTPLRVLVSGVVKTAGAIAAVFAVDPHPNGFFLTALFLFLFFWEIGGQNIPNDWADIAEDRRFKAQTLPVYLGTDWSRWLILITLVAAVTMNWLLLGLSPARFNGLYGAVLSAIAVWLLLWPAVRLFKERTRTAAMALFNKASYYPLALLALVLMRLTLS